MKVIFFLGTDDTGDVSVHSMLIVFFKLWHIQISLKGIKWLLKDKLD